MAGFRNDDIVAFQTIEVKANGTRTIAIPVDEDGRKEDIEFSHEATVLLIKGIKKRYAELSSNHRARPQIYRDLHEELTMHGYNYTVERIRRKWNNLLGTYKRVRRDHNPGKPPWEYLEMLSEFLPPDPCFSTTSMSGTLSPKTFSSTPAQVFTDQPTPSSAASTSNSSVKVHVPPPSITKDIELGVKRQALMEKYIEQVKEKDSFEMEYKKRKERRERLKIRALKRIGKELHAIAVTQTEILKKQDQILAALQS